MGNVSRSPLLAALLAALLSALLTASVFGIVGVAGAGPNETFTACLVKGQLLHVKRGTSPAQPCDLATQQVSWSGIDGKRILALEAKVAALEAGALAISRQSQPPASVAAGGSTEFVIHCADAGDLAISGGIEPASGVQFRIYQSYPWTFADAWDIGVTNLSGTAVDFTPWVLCASTP